MQQHSLFATLELENRLGQPVHLGVVHISSGPRDYVFVSALTQHASSIVGKNAEHFAFQLCERFGLEPRRFELIEVRDVNEEFPLWRWRFEWVGHSPLAARGEPVSSTSQQQMLFELLSSGSANKIAAAR